MGKVYITAAKRSAIGTMHGSLSDYDLGELGAQVIKKVIEESGVKAEEIDEVIMGNLYSAGLGGNIGRQASIKAGIPVEVPAYSVNMLCGSGMKSVMNGFTSIKAGIHRIVLTGGLENMSSTPTLIPGKVKRGQKMGNVELQDHMLKDGLIDAFYNYHMGVTAENIVDKHSIPREEQDAFALESNLRATKAQAEGRLAAEIAPVVIPSRKGDITIDQDEHIKTDATFEGLSKLRPAFKKGGTVTAGNASGINDAASALMLVDETVVEEKGLKPLAEIIAIGQAGVDPSVMGLGPVPAIRNVLKTAGMKFSDFEVIELNEAFAGQSLGVLKELSEEHGVSEEKLLEITNVDGGAIALGHPVGASGNRIIVTLLRIMKERNLTYGLATLCIGGGMGTAVIIKNMQ